MQYPEEIEEVLLEHGGIDEVAVVAKPDREWGEVPVAVIVPKEGCSLEKNEILEFARKNLASFKIPGRIEFAGALPRSSQGKILKARIREDIKEGKYP